MIDFDSLTHDLFLSTLRERLDALRSVGVDVPTEVGLVVEASLDVDPDPFRLQLFRLSVAHLLNGLDPRLADSDEGLLELEERLMDLPANLRLASRRAAASPELSTA